MADDDLARAAEILKNFKSHWERLSDDPEGQHELIKLIVERVYVEDEKVVAMTLRSNYHLVLGHKTNGPTYLEVDSLYAHGSDGTHFVKSQFRWAGKGQYRPKRPF